jgi:hypothetical protein
LSLKNGGRYDNLVVICGFTNVRTITIDLNFNRERKIKFCLPVFSVVFGVCQPSVGTRAFQVAKLQGFPHRPTSGEGSSGRKMTTYPSQFACYHSSKVRVATRIHPGQKTTSGRGCPRQQTTDSSNNIIHTLRKACVYLHVNSAEYLRRHSNSPHFTHTLCLRVSYHSNNK